MRRKITVILMAILLTTTVFSNGEKPEKFQSIHNIQFNEYKNISPKPLKSEDYFKLFSKGSISTPRVKKEVLGYYTHWKTGTSNIQWDLLTILAYFSAELNSSGNITDLNGWPSSAPINEAHAHGVKVILTATLFGSSSIRTLIQSSTNRQNCIENLFNQVKNAGADGVCIDFELPSSSDRAYFNTFIQEISNYFHSNLPGSIVVVDTPAVNWSDRIDFDTITDYADYLFIMAYDYHYSGGDPGPVAPLSYTSGSPWPTWAGIVQTLDDYINGTYGVGDSKKYKLLLGVPYYGYDWPAQKCEIPTSQRANASAVIYSTAVDKAAQYNREWDNYSQTPFYDYNCYTSYPHQAWYDDDVSIGLKYDKVNQYNIGGTGMWALNYDGTRTELWEKIREKFGFFYITATPHGNGTINPSGQIQVDYKKDITLTFNPENGYHISDVKVDGTSVGTPTSYTFSSVSTDHTIDVYFEQDQQQKYTITASAGNGGTITPNGTIEVNEGDSITFTIKPDSGYQIDKVLVDGNDVGAVSTYTFSNVSANHTIKASFKENQVNTYIITATAGNGGQIDPSGNIKVNKGESVTFIITPSNGFRIKSVIVDGKDKGIVNTYTFSNVNSNHTIEANFTEVSDKTYTIKAEAEAGGSISPAGDIEVKEGESITFYITSDRGYTVEKVVVDGQNLGVLSMHTFKDIKANHTIHAYFTEVAEPEAEYFNASTYTGLVALEVKFTCKFHDPENRKIVKYEWIATGDYEGSFETEEPEITLVFYAPGTYYVKVSATNELGIKGESDFITIRPIDLKSYPVSLTGNYVLNDRDIDLKTYLINPFNKTVRISVNTMDNEGKEKAKNITINPYEKIKLNEIISDNSKNGTYQSMITPNSFVVVYQEADGFNLGYSAYQSLNTSPKLFIPHIAEETDYWDTLASIGNKNGKNIVISVNNSGYVLESNYCNIFNLTKFAENIPENNCFGEITDANQSDVLNGYEAFIQKNNDGAAITLSEKTGNKFFIPHIPEEKDIFWTGFTFVNTEDKDGKILFYLYDDSGKMIGTKTLSIGKKQKLKGLFQNLFSDEELQNAVWGYAYSTVKTTGIEIYGVSGGAICGYALPFKGKLSGIIPMAETNNSVWTGVVALNANTQNTTVTFELYNGKGNKVGEKTITISPQTRFKSVLSDLFSISSTDENYFIKFYSTQPIVCIEVKGDRDRTYMKSLNAY